MAEDFISESALLTVVVAPEVVKFSLVSILGGVTGEFLRLGTGLGKIGSIFLFTAIVL